MIKQSHKAHPLENVAQSTAASAQFYAEGSCERGYVGSCAEVHNQLFLRAEIRVRGQLWQAVVRRYSHANLIDFVAVYWSR